MGMGSITFEQGSTVIYYDEVFNQNTLNKNPHHPKSLPDFLSHRGFKNPYQTQTEAQAEGNEKLWVAYGVKSQVAYHFYNLVITLAQNFPESNFPALWTICGPCQITPQKS
jgi:hypothetical protein